MNHYVEVKDISFDTLIEAAKTENYPNSGFFIVASEHTSDLRFVDKNIDVSYCICPASIYDGLALGIPVLPSENNLITTSESASGFVSESFVLDFTKILLNKESDM